MGEIGGWGISTVLSSAHYTHPTPSDPLPPTSLFRPPRGGGGEDRKWAAVACITPPRFPAFRLFPDRITTLTADVPGLVDVDVVSVLPLPHHHRVGGPAGGALLSGQGSNYIKLILFSTFFFGDFTSVTLLPSVFTLSPLLRLSSIFGGTEIRKVEIKD